MFLLLCLLQGRCAAAGLLDLEEGVLPSTPVRQEEEPWKDARQRVQKS